MPRSTRRTLIAGAAVAVASELAFRHIRTRADVETATEFATALFLGGIERMRANSG